MKWIKVIDRMPTEEGDYYVKYKEGDKGMLYASGTGHHSRWKALVDEWLDETPSGDGWVRVEDDRKRYMRKQANNIFELIKGFTTQTNDNAMKAAIEMAGFVQELTNELHLPSPPTA